MFSAFAALFDRIVLAHPRATLAVLAVLLLALGTGIPKFRVDASADSLLLEDDADLQRFRELGKRYAARDFLFVTVTPREPLFSPASRALLASIRADLKGLPEVESVLTVLDVPLVKNVQARLTEVATKYKTLESPDVDFDRARDELLTSPLYKNVAISADGKTTAIRVVMQDRPEFRRLQMERGDLVYLRATTGLSPAQTTRLAELDPIYKAQKAAVDEANHAAVASIRSVLARHRDEATIHLGGISMITDDLITFVRKDIAVFGIGAAVLAIGMLGYIFREARWVGIPLITCTYSVCAILGLLGLVGWDLTVISSNFIALMLILTISMNIHLLVRYMELYREHPARPQGELVRQMAHDMAKPCLYTSLTTMIGFLSLVASDIKPIIDFGWMMTLSLAIVYAILFTSIPAMMMLMPKRPLKAVEKADGGFTMKLARFTQGHGALVLVVSGLVAVLGGLGIGKLEVENSFINYFKQSTEIYQGLKHVDETLGGTTPLEIVLKFPPPPVVEAAEGSDEELADLFEEEPAAKSDYWFTPAKIERIKRVHDYLESVPGIGKVTSLASIVRVAEDLNKGREFDPFELNIIYKRLPENLKQEMLSPYISIEHDEARIALRILDSTPDLRRNALLQQIRTGLEQEVGLAPSEFEITGLMVLYNNMLQSLFTSQSESIGWTLLGVLMMLWLLFRSLKAAVIGIIPNIIAASAVLGFMGWVGIPLDMMTIMVAALTVGIAVDDCIHYLHRYKVELPVQGDRIATMYYCHASIAKAALYTTLTVCCGFSILVMSNFVPSILFGILTTVAMTAAILGALTLMPKLILMWKPFG